MTLAKVKAILRTSSADTTPENSTDSKERAPASADIATNRVQLIGLLTAIVTLIGTAFGVGPMVIDYLNDHSRAAPEFSQIEFAAKTLEGDLVEPSSTFPFGVEEIYATFGYKNMTPTTRFRRRWYGPSGAVIADYTEDWDFITWGASGSRTLPTFFDRKGWEPGTYRLQLQIDGQIAQTETFTIIGAGD